MANITIVSAAAYESISYMDSSQFCGTVCHSVMGPHYTRYQDSVHGRTLTQVHWGGSPHALDTQQRIELFNAIGTRFPLAFGADVSIGLTAAAGPSSQVFEYDTPAGTDLIGFGVGAISRVNNMFFQNFEDLEAYEDAIAADRLPVSRGYTREKRP